MTADPSRGFAMFPPPGGIFPEPWTPDTRSNAQLQAQWVELRKSIDGTQSEEQTAIAGQMQWIVAELETRRVKGIVIT